MTFRTDNSLKIYWIGSVKDLFKQYFGFRQPLKYYGMAALFLLLIFGIPLLNPEAASGITWKLVPVLLLQSLIFGGIEEIGWRFTFQPLVEKYTFFASASLIAFFSWGLWH